MTASKPDDYLMVHKEKEGIRVQHVSHYLNFSDVWCTYNEGPAIYLDWPEHGSQVVYFSVPPQKEV
jgi:hypothetical protein